MEIMHVINKIYLLLKATTDKDQTCESCLIAFEALASEILKENDDLNELTHTDILNHVNLKGN